MTEHQILFSPDGQRKYLNRVERRSFLRTVEEHCEDPLALAFCLTLYYTGCRISEALELRWNRVDFSEKAIVFRTLKRRKEGCFRIIPIPQNLVSLLDDLCMEAFSFESKIWSFSRPTGYRIIKAVMKHALISGPKAAPKGLRHGFAIACINQHVTLPRLQHWMGHASLKTTFIYLEMAGEQDRRQMEKLWKEDQKALLKPAGSLALYQNSEYCFTQFSATLAFLSVPVRRIRD